MQVRRLPPLLMGSHHRRNFDRPCSHRMTGLNNSTQRNLRLCLLQLELIEAYLSFSAGDVNHALSWDDIRKFEYYESLLPLLEYTFCSPATSAPVERVFSHGGLFMRPHRARLADSTLCDLMYSKCNKSFETCYTSSSST